MRIQTGDHARDRVGDEFFIIHRLYVIALDKPKNSRELLQLFKRQRSHSAACARLKRYGGECPGHNAQGDPTCDLKFLTHKYVRVALSF